MSYNPSNTKVHCDPLIIGAETYVITSYSYNVGAQNIPIKDSEDKIIDYYVDETKENNGSLTVEVVGTQVSLTPGTEIKYDNKDFVILDPAHSRSRGAQKTITYNIVEVFPDA